jgi:hypothetical protein
VIDETLPSALYAVWIVTLASSDEGHRPPEDELLELLLEPEEFMTRCVSRPAAS